MSDHYSGQGNNILASGGIIQATAYQVYHNVLLMWESVTFHFHYAFKSIPILVCQRDKVNIHQKS